jgi:hypothetical protein
MFQIGELVKHKASGKHYEILMKDLRHEATGELMYAYREPSNLQATVWLRPKVEMEDGRFTPAPGPKVMPTASPTVVNQFGVVRVSRHGLHGSTTLMWFCRASLAHDHAAKEKWGAYGVIELFSRGEAI